MTMKVIENVIMSKSGANNMEFTKEELLALYDEQYNNYEKMYDDNLDRIANLLDQVKAIQEQNKNFHLKMKDIVDKSRPIQREVDRMKNL